MKNIKIASIIWTLYFLVAYFSDLVLSPYMTFPAELIIFLTHNLYLFYALLYVIERFSTKSKKLTIISISRCALVLAIFFSLKYVSVYYIFPLLYEPMPEVKDIVWITAGCLWIINYSLFASAFYYFRSSIQKQKDLLKATQEKAAKEQEAAKLAQEAAQLEIAGLKAQINPHFLFNTLSYFYSKVYLTQPEVGDGIAALSDIMRSSIRKPDGDGLIPLDEEINNIEQLISIYQLRYNNTVFISFDQEGYTGSLRVLPHILITFVENALKHGELHNEKHPLQIDLKVENQNLHFSVHDKKRFGPKELSHGIGMNFIKTHLSSFYKDRCSLTVNDEEFFYSVSLTILHKHPEALAV